MNMIQGRWVPATITKVPLHALVPLLLLVPASLHAQITEIWSTTGAEEMPFGRVEGVHELSPGTIWVLDGLREHRVHILDGSGRVQGRTVRKGEGPGEMRRLHVGAETSGGMALSDGRQVHFLDRSGGYQRKVRYPHQVWHLKDMKATDEYVLFSGGLSVPGGDFEVGHEHSVFVFDTQSGEIVRSFHPASPTEGLLGWYQAGAVLDIRGNSVIAVTTAPIEIMEYDLRTGRHLRTIATDSALVQALGRDFKYKVAPHSRTNFLRWWYPRAFYAHRLDDDRLLVVTRFTREDYFTKEARSIWDIYDLRSGRRISRTETSRGYEVYDRTANGDFLAIYKNRVGESVVVRLRFEPEAGGRTAR